MKSSALPSKRTGQLLVGLAAGGILLAGCTSGSVETAGTTAPGASVGGLPVSTPSVTLPSLPTSPVPTLPSVSVPPLPTSRSNVVDGDKFTVVLPAPPVKRSQPVTIAGGKTITFVSYSTETGLSQFSVGYADYPASVQLDMDGALTGAAGKVQGTLSSRRSLTVAGKSAREAVVSNASLGGSTKGTVFVTVVAAGRRVYTIISTAPGRLTTVTATHSAMRDSLSLR